MCLVFDKSNFILFADDLKSFNVIHTVADCFNFQNDLNNLSIWCLLSGLQLSIDKCFSISFTRKNNRIVFNYSSNFHLLPHVSSIKDLGVIFSCTLSFSEHIQSTIAKSSQTLNFIMRNTQDFALVKPLKVLYMTLIRSFLVYGSVMWNPFQAVYSTKLEHKINFYST